MPHHTPNILYLRDTPLAPDANRLRTEFRLRSRPAAVGPPGRRDGSSIRHGHDPILAVGFVRLVVPIVLDWFRPARLLVAQFQPTDRNGEACVALASVPRPSAPRLRQICRDCSGEGIAAFSSTLLQGERGRSHGTGHEFRRRLDRRRRSCWVGCSG